MTDLRAFKCQISLDSLRDIPQIMSIVLGEEVFSVMLHLESWERVANVEGGEPPAPPQGGPGNENQQHEGRGDIVQPNEGTEGADEEIGEGAGEIDEARSERSVNRDLGAWSVRRAPVGRTPRPTFGRRSRIASDRDGAGRWLQRMSPKLEVAASKAAPFTGMAATLTLEQKAQHHHDPFLKIYCPSQSPMDLARHECRSLQAATRGEIGEAFNGLTHSSGPNKTKLATFNAEVFLLEWRGGYLITSEKGKWALSLTGPYQGATLTKLNWITFIGLMGRHLKLMVGGGLYPTSFGPPLRASTQAGRAIAGTMALPRITMDFGSLLMVAPDGGFSDVPSTRPFDGEVATDLATVDCGLGSSDKTHKKPTGCTGILRKKLTTLPSRARSFLDKRVFVEANGASGGLITCWSSRVFTCHEVIVRRFSITVLLTLLSDGTRFFLTNVYGPPTWEGKEDFFSELQDLKDCCKGKWILGNGRHIDFWEDRWCGETTLRSSFPELFHLSPGKNLKICDGLNSNGWCWETILGGDTSVNPSVCPDITALKGRISNVSISQGQDSVHWRWSTDGCFTVLYVLDDSWHIHLLFMLSSHLLKPLSGGISTQLTNLIKMYACVKRVENDETGHKHCTGQYFDYWLCIDNCSVAKPSGSRGTKTDRTGSEPNRFTSSQSDLWFSAPDMHCRHVGHDDRARSHRSMHLTWNAWSHPGRTRTGSPHSNSVRQIAHSGSAPWIFRPVE
ncbi:Cytochrome b-c1 complex subunit 6 [Ananas comosus]|uniref:Cytochrome b-c1 complex subunit 6 n=1 Tax=Ananas comosus TaxID=4615 RepID=A0A199VZC6_ANACO|nr:Cytochrome b-c1 complex subunit 6 [Ananas comosus]